MISVDNLDENLKKRYKQLAVFLDDSSVPKKVNACKIIWNIYDELFSRIP